MKWRRKRMLHLSIEMTFTENSVLATNHGEQFFPIPKDTTLNELLQQASTDTHDEQQDEEHRRPKHLIH